ncbi:MAG: hypothetical protein MUC36_11135 [Planctomycetes bacterium]|nr:hypothetical protein [Planctomycetota bacterium]
MQLQQHAERDRGVRHLTSRVTVLVAVETLGVQQVGGAELRDRRPDAGCRRLPRSTSSGDRLAGEMLGEDLAIPALGLGAAVAAQVDHPALAIRVAQTDCVLAGALVVENRRNLQVRGLHRIVCCSDYSSSVR